MRGLLLSLFAVVAVPLSAAAPKLVWSDEFAEPIGTGPNEKHWNCDLGNNNGWGNRELQVYTDARENSVIADDPAATDGRALVIRATKTFEGTATSARIKTKGKFAARYGRIEARMKLPYGQGIWPAFWMLAADIDQVKWPACGEIDIMEMVGHQPGTLYATLHGPGYSGTQGVQGKINLPVGERFADAYHVFAIDWAPGKIEWLLDGRVFHTATLAELPAGTKWVFDDRPFFLILNLAVGGGWPGNPHETTIFPQEFRIDYVRVYAGLPKNTD